MARVYCIEWFDDDEAKGMHVAGWSLHLSRTQAGAYAQTHEARHDRHDPPRVIEVPAEILDAVTATREGMFWATSMNCPFPTVAETDRELGVPIERDMRVAVPDDRHAPADAAEVAEEQDARRTT